MLEIQISLSTTIGKSYKRIVIERDFITQENGDDWQDYLIEKIKECVTPEAMQTPLFREVQQKNLQHEQYLMQLKEEEQYLKYRKSLLRIPKLAYIPEGLTVNYTEIYRPYADSLVAWKPRDGEDYAYLLSTYERMVKKSFDKMIALQRPDAAYALYHNLCQYLPAFIGRSYLKAYHSLHKPQLRKMVVLAYTHLMESAIRWNNEEARLAVNALIAQDAASYDSIGLKSSKLQSLQTTVVLVGEPLTMERQQNKEERRQAMMEAYRAELEEKIRMEEEAEKHSLIPLHPNMEELFKAKHIDWECMRMSSDMLTFKRSLEQQLKTGKGREALLLFLQMMKSLCRHFICDEHYSYFDDMYDPEYSAESLFEIILQHRSYLTPADVTFFKEAWQEIEQTEAVQDYGILGRIGCCIRNEF